MYNNVILLRDGGVDKYILYTTRYASKTEEQSVETNANDYITLRVVTTAFVFIRFRYSETATTDACNCKRNDTNRGDINGHFVISRG